MQIGGGSTQILFEALLTSITVRSSTAPPGSCGVVVVVVVRSESVGSSQSDNSISSSELVSAESELSAR